jgi:hypothetical protein
MGSALHRGPDGGFRTQRLPGCRIPRKFCGGVGYFNSLQEKDPTVAGSKGGWGHAQWTGPRRVTFEAWLKRSGHDVDSYEGNYTMVFRELKSAYYDRVVLEPLKKAKNLEDAVKIVGKYYEAPAVLNMAPPQGRSGSAGPLPQAPAAR